MIEKHLLLDEADPGIFYGVQNSNLKMLKSLYPKLRIIARGNVICIQGEEKQINEFEERARDMIAHCVNYNRLSEEDIIGILNGNTSAEGLLQDGVIVYSTTGKAIRPRNKTQESLVNAFHTNDMVFAIGPAGTGKTYLSIALAIEAFKKKQIRKIILSRPAVEAGEKLGFLPGDMKEKIDPYLQPLYDALEEMVPHARLQELLASNVIQIAPLAFMRGRTLNDAVVILDEAQNTTPMQMKMFLTRMGENSRMVINGDLSQTDLPRGVQSGLADALDVLRNVKDIAVVTFTEKDVVRHGLVSSIVKAYDKRYASRKGLIGNDG